MKTMTEDTEFVIVDVRTPSEWNNGYISGTDKFIEYNSDDFEKNIQELDKTKNYVLYCRSGNRSGKACEIMSRNGFMNLYNLSGGIIQWTGEIKKD